MIKEYPNEEAARTALNSFERALKALITEHGLIFLGGAAAKCIYEGEERPGYCTEIHANFSTLGDAKALHAIMRHSIEDWDAEAKNEAAK